MARMWAAVCVLALATAAAATPSPPVFPTAYSATLTVAASNGQTSTTNAYWQRSPTLNATAYIGSGGSTIWDFGNGNNGNVYSIFGGRCRCYCPITGQLQCNLEDSLCTYDYKKSAKYSGSATVDNTPSNIFKWNEDLFGIPMNELTLFVDASTSYPVKQIRVITPFGKYQGTENTTWTNFKVGAPPASVWTVPDKQYCQQCQQATCNSDVAAALFHGMRVPAKALHTNE